MSVYSVLEKMVFSLEHLVVVVSKLIFQNYNQGFILCGLANSQLSLSINNSKRLQFTKFCRCIPIPYRHFFVNGSANHFGHLALTRHGAQAGEI